MGGGGHCRYTSGMHSSNQAPDQCVTAVHKPECTSALVVPCDQNT